MRAVQFCALLCLLTSAGCGATRVSAQSARSAASLKANDHDREPNESESLAALRRADLELFGSDADGQLPASVEAEAEDGADASPKTYDVRWLRGLKMPDIPVRWHARVVKYLDYFKNDPKGQALISGWLKRLGRYRPALRKQARQQNVPADVIYLAMVESGFDPKASSRVGAVGLWQFMDAAAREYGLEKTHWVDQRMDPELSTRAALVYLKDLHRRLGSWEMAFAAYNMGYTALLRAVRKYNTNDFWTLAQLEAALPFETLLYVPKIMACAIVGRNAERFGLGSIVPDPAIQAKTVPVPPGLSFSKLAEVVGVKEDELAALNPELRRHRTPLDRPSWMLRVPAAKADKLARAVFPKKGQDETQTYLLRFGERVGDVARRFGAKPSEIRKLNELRDNEDFLAGSTILVPAHKAREVDAEDVSEAARDDAKEPALPVVAIPDRTFSYEDRKHVFYPVADGDTYQSIAEFFAVTIDELRQWNRIDTRATLQSGMILQLFVPKDVAVDRAKIFLPDQVQTLVLGSERFYEHHEDQRGRKRLRYRVQEGDTLGSIATRFGLSVGSLARINRFSKDTSLRAGREIVVYAARDKEKRVEPVDKTQSEPSLEKDTTSSEGHKDRPRVSDVESSDVSTTETEISGSVEPAAAEPKFTKPSTHAKATASPRSRVPTAASERARTKRTHSVHHDPQRSHVRNRVHGRADSADRSGGLDSQAE